MAKIVLCTVEACGNKVHGRGLCNAHRIRLARYGSLTGKAPPKSSAVQDWLRDVALTYDGDDCLPFPFARMRNGYGTLTTGGVNKLAHVFVIEATKGKKTDPSHECRHLCGNGRLACVNKTHLEWGTHKQNCEDAVAHGTTKINRTPRRGKDHHAFRATDEIVLAIRNDLAGGMARRAAGIKYGFSQFLIYQVHNRLGRFSE